MSRRGRHLYRISLFLLILVASPQPALAADPIVVGNGTAASCTETALKSALLVAETLGGGTVRFECGPDLVTLPLSGVAHIHGLPVLLVLPNNTAIDGGGLVTLDGTDTGIVVFVGRGTTAALKRLTITRGRGPDQLVEFFAPGGIINFGALTITRSTVSANSNGSSGFGVGGIWNTGSMTIDHSEISANTGIDGGGIANEGTLRIHNAVFADNGTVNGGGGIVNTGTLEIANTRFLRNVSLDGVGGAIFSIGTMTLNRSFVTENLAAFAGGGILNTGTLNVRHSTFAENDIHAFGGGGGVSNSGALTVHHSTFSGNRSTEGGGGILNRGVLNVRDSRFSDNDGGEFAAGGGIYNDGDVTLTGSTLSNNVAGQGGGIFTAGALAVKTSIITHNTAVVAGGGIHVCVDCQGSLTLKNTIVTGNTPDDIFQ